MLAQRLIIVLCILGIVTAFGIHELFRRLRSHLLLPTAVIGWIFSVFVAFFALIFTGEFIKPIFVPPPATQSVNVAYISGRLALIISVISLLICGIGLIHSRYFSISWLKAFGLLMTEGGVVALIWLITNPFDLYLQKFLIVGDPISWNYFNSYDHARNILFCFDKALIISLLLLEILDPLVRRRKIISQPV